MSRSLLLALMPWKGTFLYCWFVLHVTINEMVWLWKRADWRRKSAVPHQPTALDGQYRELMEAFLTAGGFWPSVVGRYFSLLAKHLCYLSCALSSLHWVEVYTYATYANDKINLGNIIPLICGVCTLVAIVMLKAQMPIPSHKTAESRKTCPKILLLMSIRTSHHGFELTRHISECKCRKHFTHSYISSVWNRWLM